MCGKTCILIGSIARQLRTQRSALPQSVHTRRHTRPGLEGAVEGFLVVNQTRAQHRRARNLTPPGPACQSLDGRGTTTPKACVGGACFSADQYTHSTAKF